MWQTLMTVVTNHHAPCFFHRRLWCSSASGDYCMGALAAVIGGGSNAVRVIGGGSNAVLLTRRRGDALTPVRPDSLWMDRPSHCWLSARLPWHGSLFAGIEWDWLSLRCECRSLCPPWAPSRSEMLCYIYGTLSNEATRQLFLKIYAS